MLGEYILPAWTLFVFILGYVFGYGAGSPSTSDDEDDNPGAATADELEQ